MFSEFSFQAQATLPSKWDFWPFNAGTGGDWETTTATYLFSALILGVISLFLRFLFGPGGIWRDKELEREAELTRQKALDTLNAQLEDGEITELEYKRKKRSLEA